MDSPAATLLQMVKERHDSRALALSAAIRTGAPVDRIEHFRRRRQRAADSMADVLMLVWHKVLDCNDSDLPRAEA